MVDIGFDDNADSFLCEGCGAELPAFLDDCPYCSHADDDDQTSACPSCGAEIYDDAQRCSQCGDWVTVKVEGGHTFSTGAGKVVLLLVIVALVLYLLRSIV